MQPKIPERSGNANKSGQTLIGDEEWGLVSAAALGALRPADTSSTSPIHPRAHWSPPPLPYLRCWGWPKGSGAPHTREGTSKGDPLEVRNSSLPERQGRGGCRRCHLCPGSVGVPHRGARSPAFSTTLFCLFCPAWLSLRFSLGGRGERRGTPPPGGVLCLLALNPSKCGNHKSAETTEVCSGSCRPLFQLDKMN